MIALDGGWILVRHRSDRKIVKSHACQLPDCILCMRYMCIVYVVVCKIL